MLSPREHGDSGIGLGWILAIALVGGILCFAALGYLLVWQIRKSGAPVTTQVYAADVAARPDGPSNSSTVLSKRRFLRTESELTLHANQDHTGDGAIPLQEGVRENGGRVVPWKPPVLPPLAKQGWMTTGDEEHGPKTRRKSWRDSWTNMMVLVGAKPTIPNVDSMNDLEVGAEQPVLDVPKTRSTPQTLPQSQTAPELGEEERGRPRTVSHYRGRAMGGPSVNDVDLKVILASTEQRLRDGSQSPVKTPKSSPGKNSTRTPRSGGKSASTRGSPSKRSAIHQTPTKSRNPSISTVGSAANSLIRHAIEELRQPGGSTSPSRARVSEWEDQQKNTVAARPESPRKRSNSIDSDISSALSTLYSVGEPEEEVTLPTPKKAVTPQEKQHESFVHQTCPGVVSLRHGVAGPRTTRGASGGGNDTASAIPAPLRTINANSKIARRGSIKMQPHLVLSPPKARNPDIAAKIVTQRVASENSIASESVYTDVTVADTSSEDEQTTPKAKQGHRGSKSSTSTVATPTRTMKSLDLSSSPLNEREVMSILYESARPKRGLPSPPAKIMSDENMVPTPLSPRPKKRYAPSRRVSIASVSSSNYDHNLDEENHQFTGISGRRATTSGFSANLSVGSTISELRRMNSVVSSYSVASMASSCGGIDRSPTITSLRGGGFSPDRPNSKNASDGRRNYLSMGGQNSPKRNNSSHRRGQSHSGIPIRADKIQVDMSAAEKENRGPPTTGPRVRFDLSASTNALRDGRDRRSGLAPPQLVASRVEAIATEERRRANRWSADSLGLYDQDGFLKGSPDRDAVAKAGRWRM
ncbi:uncharacterized protein J7T54_008115 [Emericellopsis cladophorae]|uniref:Uncharacterized protein n=1 Tax=Emericellopsis cladophorae TaxID=2686198 RepID=A0A9P9Y7P8_9HYPO|nr:uncharacterized protein J7T54_008115 [Emericellopsis cladophorae]KAI6785021.1 hypothetical protein J7T54_008115 [Emericellopsis cladophorae]